MLSSGWPLVLALAGGIGLLLGFVAAATRYCHMGALADWVNIGDRTRLQAWALSIAAGLVGVAILEITGVIDLDVTRLNYRGATLAWTGSLIGGTLFGAGMCLAGGCITRTLVNIGSGNIKSLYVLVVLALSAYAMLFTATGNDLYRAVVQAPAISLASPQHNGQDPGRLLLGSTHAGSLMTDALSLVLGLSILLLIARQRPWRHRRIRLELAGGLTIGLLVLGGWYITGSHWAQRIWDSLQWAERLPAGMGTQSFTFTGPSAEWLRYISHPDNHLLTFGMLAMAGVVIGAALQQLGTRRFRLAWFTSCRDCIRHTAGAIMMGAGGVLAGGCSVGQGLTGISTLGLGSAIALAGILGGGLITMKMIYYGVMFPEASIIARLTATLADLHLLPKRFHRLNTIPTHIVLRRCGG